MKLRATLLLFALLCTMASQAIAQSTAQPLEKFLQLKPRWKELVGTRFRVEGRYRLASKRLLKFQNCDLSFKSKRDFPSLSGRSKTIEVSGRLMKSNGQIIFAVDSIKELPDDISTLKTKQAKLTDPTPKDWYDLGEWARSRAKFYEDDQLEQQAIKTFLIGIQIERNAIKKDTFAKLLALSQKVKALNLPERLRMQYVHEAVCVDWLAARQPINARNLATLQKSLPSLLPGSTTPWKKPKTVDEKKYFQGPVLFYHNAADAVRLELHRVLYVDVAKKVILAGANQNGSNGSQIAARLDETIPELHELAETFRDKELDYRESRVTTLERRQMYRLVDDLRKRKRDERPTVTTWLAAHKATLSKQGHDGLVQFANECQTIKGGKYLSDSDYRSLAFKALEEADELRTNSPQVALKMQELGYVKYKNTWQLEEDVPKEARRQFADNMAKGGIQVGMTKKQVDPFLPSRVADSVVRIVSAERTIEIWVFGQRGQSRLSIQFVRRRNDKHEEMKVIGVSQINPK